MITTQQRLSLLQLSTQPSAAEGDSSTRILSPKRPRSIGAQQSGQWKHHKPQTLSLSSHNFSTPQLKPFPSHFSSKENCVHSNPGKSNRNQI